MMLKRKSSCSPKLARRGAVAIWGVVCLILATAVAAMLGKLALTGSRIILQEHRHAQCEWLVQSGWSLAKSRLAENPGYMGETWEISAPEMGGSDVGEVVIEVVLPKADATLPEHRILISARYPKDASRQVRLTQSRIWK